MVYFKVTEREGGSNTNGNLRTCDWNPIYLLIFQLLSPLDLRMTLSIRSMYPFGLTQIIRNNKYGIVNFIFCFFGCYQ